MFDSKSSYVNCILEIAAWSSSLLFLSLLSSPDYQPLLNSFTTTHTQTTLCLNITKSRELYPQKFVVFFLLQFQFIKSNTVQSQFKDQITGLLELVEMSIIKQHFRFCFQFVLLFKLISAHGIVIACRFIQQIQTETSNDLCLMVWLELNNKEKKTRKEIEPYTE